MSGREHRSASGGTRPVPAGRDPSGADRSPAASQEDMARLVDEHGGLDGGWCGTCDEWECVAGVAARRALVRLRVGG